MSVLFQLISHEYRKYVFTRGFLLFLLIIPLSAAFGFFASTVNEQVAPQRSFIVIDETGRAVDVIEEALEERRTRIALRVWDTYIETMLTLAGEEVSPLEAPFAPARRTDARVAAFSEAGGIDAAFEAAQPYLPEGTPKPPLPRDGFVLLDTPSAVLNMEDSDARTELLRDYVRGTEKVPGSEGPLFAAVIIPSDVDDGGTVRFWTNNLIDGDLRDFIDRALTDDLQERAFIDAGFDPMLIDTIQALSIDVNRFKASGDGDGPVGGIERAATILPLILAYGLFALVLSIGGILLTNTVEEKSNKIVEILLSSVSATQLMAGKLIALALVGLTVPAIFALAGLGTITVVGLNLPEEITGGALDTIRAALFESPLIPLFLFYFVCAYLLFASVYLAVGALTDSLQDAQTFLGPLNILLVLPLPFLPVIVQDPNGFMAQLFTWIPFYTPFIIMLRLSSNPPFWEIVAATGVFLVFTGYVLTLMGRIYRNGILGSGSGVPTFRQVRDLAKNG